MAEYFVLAEPIKEIARDLRLSRNTVRKILRSEDRRFSSSARCSRPRSSENKQRNSMGCWRRTPKHRRAKRLTLIRLFEEWRALACEGSYDAVRRYAGAWAKTNASATANALSR